MEIKIDRDDARKLNKLRAELQLAQAELELFYSELENKYDFCIQYDTLNTIQGTIEKVTPKAEGGGNDADN